MSCSAHTQDGEHVLVVQILWASDESDVSSGWKLCLAGDAPSSTLSNAPSSMPTHAPSHVEMRRRRSTALTTGAICWEARKSDYGCFGYTEVGYTCVGEYCAAMDPGGTPQDCAQQMPAGYVLDAGTGKCVEHATTARQRRTHAYSVQARIHSGRRSFTPLAKTHFDKTTAEGQILRNSTIITVAELAQQSAEEIAFRSISRASQK